jgi:hypothetical protein
MYQQQYVNTSQSRVVAFGLPLPRVVSRLSTPSYTTTKGIAPRTPRYTSTQSVMDTAFRPSTMLQSEESQSQCEEPKFRQLPCKTFVSVGSCPYRDRCVYLHDPRLVYKEAKTKTRKKNSEDSILDSFFWPVMSEKVSRVAPLTSSFSTTLPLRPNEVTTQ